MPERVTVVGTSLIFRKKPTKDGELERYKRYKRYKARLVTQGSLQIFNIDFFDTYATAAHLISFRIIYARVASYHSLLAT